MVIVPSIHDIKLASVGSTAVSKSSGNSIDFIVKFSPLNSKPSDFSSYTLNPVITLETEYDDSDIEDESELVTDKFNITQQVIDNEYHMIITPTSETPLTEHKTDYNKDFKVKANLYKDNNLFIMMDVSSIISVLA